MSQTRRNVKTQEYSLQANTKITCAQFSQKYKEIFIAGDSRNQLSIWKQHKEKPQLLLSGNQTNAAVQTEISALQFSMCETEAFSGSNRGIINIWDLDNAKLSCSLKGHATSVNCLARFSEERAKHWLVSGAYDGSIKLWDTRSKNSLCSFRSTSHSQQVNCLHVSPDNKWVVSGSQEGLIKIWDLREQKCIQTLGLHDGPITSLQFHQEERTLASGSMDRTIKYWDLDSFGLISSTKKDSQGVQLIRFQPDGKAAYGAYYDSLKVYDLEKGGVVLDQLESHWKNVLDMQVTDRQVISLTQTHSAFGLWVADRSNINYDPDMVGKDKYMGDGLQGQAVQPQPPQNKQKNFMKDLDESRYDAFQVNRTIKPVSQPMQIHEEQPIQQNHPQYQQFQSQPYQQNNDQQFLAQQGMQQYQPQQNIQNTPMDLEQDKKPVQQAFNQQMNFHRNIPKEVQEQDVKVPGVAHESKSSLYIQQQQQYDMQLEAGNLAIQNQQTVSKEEAQQNEKILGMMEESNSFGQQSLMDVNQDQRLDIDFSMILGKNNNDRYVQLEAINDNYREHSKFYEIISQRKNYMRQIAQWVNTNNTKTALNAVNQLQEPSLILDAFRIATSGKHSYHTLPLEAGCLYLHKCQSLLNSKYTPHVNAALDIVQKIYVAFGNELVSVKAFKGGQGVDLNREDKFRKYDELLGCFKEVYQHARLAKLLRNNDEMANKARALHQSLTALLTKCNVLQGNQAECC